MTKEKKTEIKESVREVMRKYYEKEKNTLFPQTVAYAYLAGKCPKMTVENAYKIVNEILKEMLEEKGI